VFIAIVGGILLMGSAGVLLGPVTLAVTVPWWTFGDAAWRGTAWPRVWPSQS